MTFGGRAVATKYRGHNDSVYESKFITADNATLTFDPDTKDERLVMAFDNYYTVTINRNGDDYVMYFDGDVGDDKKYMLYTKEVHFKQGDANNSVHADMNYYGEDANPTEVVGTFGYEEFDAGFNGAFGATRK